MSTGTKDRPNQLLQPGAQVNGIDYVEVGSDSKTLYVHFLNSLDLTPAKAHITGGETVRDIHVTTATWGVDAAGKPLLTLAVSPIGDFSPYTLTISGPAPLDPYLSHTSFVFRPGCIGCPTEFPYCPPPEGDPPQIDYLAKDFLSFRRALLDFSSARYPAWLERSEADVGMVMLEALSALGDEFSYLQDRVHAEASLETATQRRSLVRLARLVDYEPAPTRGATVLLQLDVLVTGVAAGTLVVAQAPDGTQIPFEVGTGVRDSATYPTNPLWNRWMRAHWWDESDRLLQPGATELWLRGHRLGLHAGQQLLLETTAEDGVDRPQRELITVVGTPSEDFDSVFPEHVTNVFPAPVTRIALDPVASPKLVHDLSRTRLAGNLIPATQGRRREEQVRIPSEPRSQGGVVVRAGANQGLTYQWTLGDGPLCWRPAPPDSDVVYEPDILVLDGASSQALTWHRSLLEADPFEAAYTVDHARYRSIDPANPDFVDYDGDDADTIRFGDGEFGLLPDPRATFVIRYRTGLGAAGNVAADSITDVARDYAGMVRSVNNPFPAAGGADPESALSVKRLAPKAFAANPLRAVRPEDYVRAMRTLDWVTSARATFRWTGSWLTIFASADPAGSEVIADSQRTELLHLLNRYRMAGYECYAPDPQYVSVDLEITVCAQPEAFASAVRAGLALALSSRVMPDGTLGFFARDRFVFGSGLDPNLLEAAIQSVAGVAGVRSIQYRVRGVDASFRNLTDKLTVLGNQLLRCDNDPSRPDAGTLRINVEGGR
jgi:hypothetical protein